jgi:hypothetical protein
MLLPWNITSVPDLIVLDSGLAYLLILTFDSVEQVPHFSNKITGSVAHFKNRGTCTASGIVFRVQVRSNGRRDSFGEMSSRIKGEWERERGGRTYEK